MVNVAIADVSAIATTPHNLFLSQTPEPSLAAIAPKFTIVRSAGPSGAF